MIKNNKYRYKIPIREDQIFKAFVLYFKLQ